MIAECSYLPYKAIGAFSKMALDYIAADEKLSSFYQHPVSIEGIKASIEARKKFPQNRLLLVQQLKAQYDKYTFTDGQEANIDALLQPNTFSITTAHQPNIFTGPLYFIYKILHAIKLANELKQQLPQYHFVPIYYMGSEDADLDELGHIYLPDGEKLTWQTNQQGAVGRMKTSELDKLINRLEGEFAGLPHGKEMIELLKTAYNGEKNIQQATLYLVNELFKEFGLLVLIPDNAALKKAFNPIVTRELFEQFSHPLVAQTTQKIGEHYKVQAAGRVINLFYLADNGRRERIERLNNDEATPVFRVNELDLFFTKEEILNELHNHPERFSVNVILRGVFQETILPNIAFIGGGGELAYWLELKAVFAAAAVPFPVLVMRNSFLLMDAGMKRIKNQLNLQPSELFLPEIELMNLQAIKNTDITLNTLEQQNAVYELYAKLQQAASLLDPTLKPHVAALHTGTLKGLLTLEKKMLRAARKKDANLQQKIIKLRQAVFPNNNLQERTGNFMPLFARYGKALISKIYDASLTMEQQFGILEL